MDESTFICDFLPSRFCLRSRNVCPSGSQPACAAGSCCNPYPLYYGAALAFSMFPLPAIPSATLADQPAMLMAECWVYHVSFQ